MTRSTPQIPRPEIHSRAIPRQAIERRPIRRRAAAMMLALFIMTVASATVIYILDTETIQFASLRNMLAYDRARYLSEAGLQHAMAELEANFNWRTGLVNVEFPAGSGGVYNVTAVDGADGSVVVASTGSIPVGNGVIMSRRLQITVKQGG